MSFISETHDYILKSWMNCIRKRDNRKDFVLPYDFIPPCIDGELTDLYYWDTYFTNKGLIADGFSKYAFYNIENLKFCLRKFGCVPNMCRANGAEYASQPPLLVFMADDYYEYSRDKNFLADTYDALLLEYKFWQTKRMLDCGLNRYGTNKKNLGDAKDFIAEYTKRCNTDLSSFTEEEITQLRISKNAEGESGEDHTPRFSDRAKDIAPIDLNSYLYGFERLMVKFAQILNNGQAAAWESRGEKRKSLIDRYMKNNATGVFFDYDTGRATKTHVYCAACYTPFVFGLSDDNSALTVINDKLIETHGVVSCEPIKGNGVFQWGYPNMWAPHNYFAYVANDRSGNTEKAVEIANKYLETISNVFKKTGKIFEKYDATTGDKTVFNEYGLPEMLGWTAGIYEYFFYRTNKF